MCTCTPKWRRTLFLSPLILLTLGTWAAADPPEQSGSIVLKRVTVEPLPVNPNLATNPGFEETTPGGLPVGWQWDPRNTDATLRVDTKIVHQGRRSVRFTNGTEFGPHIYGMMWSRSPVMLHPHRQYTLSAWVKSAAPGMLTIIGGARWQFRAVASATGDEWHRIAVSFRPREDDLSFTIRVNTESPTKAAWVDDIKLEEGSDPTPDPPASGADAKSFLGTEARPNATQGDGPFRVAFTGWVPHDLNGTAIVLLNTGESLHVPVHLPRGFQRIVVEGEAVGVDDTPGRRPSESRLALRTRPKPGPRSAFALPGVLTAG